MPEGRFEPIAIVGRGCLLPGASSPAELWQAICETRDLLSAAKTDDWGIHPEEAPTKTRRGGFVGDFDTVAALKQAGYEPEDIDQLDPVFLWLLHAGLSAWSEAGAPRLAPERHGVILANLGYPSRGLCDLASDLWLEGESDRLPLNRLNTGAPARRLAEALGAEGCAFAIDAACASSLYAVKLACDRLQDRSLDLVTVGAVNGADSLLLQQGFSALNAISPTGQSRPFVEGADGLVPAEGAAAVILKRLSDCAPDDHIFGIVRGVGLSNDGRRKSLLAPDPDGQTEAMARAWASAGLDPAREAGLIEAHATGTPVGDKVEIGSTARFFERDAPLAIGSLKGNLGHLITVAGLASLIKVTEAFAHRTLPPTRLAWQMAEAFSGTHLVPVTEAAPWPEDMPLCAGISNFGFGGNNAHLIVSAERPELPAAQLPTEAETAIAVAGLGLSAGPARGVAAVLRTLTSNAARKPATEVRLNPAPMRTPPRELAAAQAQQGALFDAVDEALSELDTLPGERTGVFAGFSCAPETAQWVLRTRIAKRFGLEPEGLAAKDARDAICPELAAADVLGAMPNIPANRINSSRDYRAFGFSVMEETASGLRALELAVRALRAGEIDHAIVAAADMSAEPVHEWALENLGGPVQAGDSAVALVLSRADACADPLALIEDIDLNGTDSRTELIARRFGVAHAAHGLFSLGCALAVARRGLEFGSHGLVPRYGGDRVDISVSHGRVSAWAPRQPAGDPVRATPLIQTFAGDNRPALARDVETGAEGASGQVRLALLAESADGLRALRNESLSALKRGEAPSGDGIHFGEGKPDGELAFMFTGAAAAYRGMGLSLFSAFPELAPALAAKFRGAEHVSALLSSDLESAFDQLRATTLVSQAQSLVLRDFLGLEPSVAIGLSSGETNALIAFGAWNDADAMLDEIGASGMYQSFIGTRFESAKAHWKTSEKIDWQTWRVRADDTALRNAAAREDRCDLTIVYSRKDGVISGTADACARVMERAGATNPIRIAHDLVVHTPIMSPYADTWHRLHHRETRAPAGIRFYANAINDSYAPDADSVAEMLTAQAVQEVNFPKTLRKAHADGVRTFIEIGPRDTLARATLETIGDSARAFVCDRFASPALTEIAEIAAALFAEGRSLRIDWLKARLAGAAQSQPLRRQSQPGDVVIPAHRTPSKPKVPAMKTLRPVPETHVRAWEGAGDAPPERDRRIASAPGVTWQPPEPPSAPPRPAPAKPAPVQQGRGIKLLPWRTPSGPAYSRDQLELLAHGRISEVYGEAFAPQDGYRRQVRMPRPPLLLCDRITGIDAEPLKLGKGTIWTETDVTADHWAVSNGVMRPGPLIEAGQADLALISWMGADMANRSERVYRLLGCELTYHEGGLPRVGETLRFQISITRHAELSGVRMFFFEYDCYADDRPVLSVRSGQAGFFTDEELANSKGVIWSAEASAPPTKDYTPPKLTTSQKTAFGPADLDELRAGRPHLCFGEGFARAAAHSYSPKLPAGRLALIDAVTEFDAQGGPWGRGHLKARQSVPSDAWFYDGHFHEDPCMPGTLMAEAAVQALEVTAGAMGLTIERDSFRFEPADGKPATFFCRGQVIPDADHEVTYEIFVDEIIEGDEPRIFAALLARCDGEKVFYCPRFGLRLTRVWQAPAVRSAPHFVHPESDIRGDYEALLACGSGAPSLAFGSMYARFDNEKKIPRLPQPPYHTISRVLSASAPHGEQKAGVTVVAEFDIDPGAWYFEDSGAGTMPFSVLTEVVLQPCGWLASYCGLGVSGDVMFRNLDGDGRTHRQVGPRDGLIRTTTTLTRISRIGAMSIVFFELESTLGDGTPVMTLNTSFGFFTESSLASQAGLPTGEADRAAKTAPASPPATLSCQLSAPGGRLKLIDETDFFEPEGGARGLGLVRGRQAVDPDAWYFKAHFFSDPVQPGSLGLEMLVQMLARAADLKGLGAEFTQPGWEPIAPETPLKWSYRGQVTPKAHMVTPVVEISAVETGAGEIIVTGRGSIWVNDLRIYEMTGISVRLFDRAHAERSSPVITLMPGAPSWVGDHCPTHTRPALPLLSQAGMLARGAVSADEVAIIEDLQAHKWALVPETGLKLFAKADGDRIHLMARDAVVEVHGYGAVSSGRVASGMAMPEPEIEPFEPGPSRPLPYETAEMFHGPALQALREWRCDERGFTGRLSLDHMADRSDRFDAVLLDALVHGVPDEAPETWFDALEGQVMYPVRIEQLAIAARAPAGDGITLRGRPKSRAVSQKGEVEILIEAYDADGLWASLHLVQKGFPKGPLGALQPVERRAFLRGTSAEHPAPLSRFEDDASWLKPSDVLACDWLPGTVATAWGADGLTGTALIKAVAVKEHFARFWGVHPREIAVDAPFARHGGRRARFNLRFDRAARAWKVSQEHG